MFSEILRKNLSIGNFIAHIGGDDFFCRFFLDETFENIYKVTSEIQEEFRISVSSLYNEEDINKQFIIAKDRFGVNRKFPLLSVSTAIIELNKNSSLNSFNDELGKIKKTI